MLLRLLLGLVLAVEALAQTPPAAPPQSIPGGFLNVIADEQEKEGDVYRLKGHAELEDSRRLFRADEIEWNRETGDVTAKGHVYYRSFKNNDQLWADHLEYNTEAETGRFYLVRGEMQPKIIVRPGVLSTSNPFHFEGAYADRIGDKYILYNGWVTNCKLPHPWWRMRGPKFDIIPEDRVISHRSVIILRNVPMFYAPFFYHSLAKEPRKSGFLMPNIVPHSQRGFMFGLGYYWAISRSYDATYQFQDFTSNAFVHHVDFRGKPRPGTDFDFILYGAQDHGRPGLENPPTYSGVSIYAVGKSDLGAGWTARGNVNYISSFRFRQEWSESYNEAIASEIKSVGSLTKNWSTFSFNAEVSRLQNFQSSEIAVTDPDTNDTTYLANAVTIRKVPEADLSARDRRIWKNVPLWWSFESTAGLLFRSEPILNANGSAIVDRFETNQFTNRVHFAPHITGSFHLGPLNLVPSMGIYRDFLRGKPVDRPGQYPCRRHQHRTQRAGFLARPEAPFAGPHLRPENGLRRQTQARHRAPREIPLSHRHRNRLSTASSASMKATSSPIPTKSSTRLRTGCMPNGATTSAKSLPGN